MSALQRDLAAPAAKPGRWYAGKSHGSFVGFVKEVDLRGSLPAIKVVLSAGGKQLDCVCRGVDVAAIREALDKRVRVTGSAIYDGKSGLPRRVEIMRIEHFKADPDITRWVGSFEPFEQAEWLEQATLKTAHTVETVSVWDGSNIVIREVSAKAAPADA